MTKVDPEVRVPDPIELDRAEELFHALCASPTYRQPSLRSLLDIYIRERDWTRAIETAAELETQSGVSFRKEIAQFHCELAVAAASASGMETAREELQHALAVNPECVRANIMLGDMQAAAGARLEAIATWKRIEQQKPQSLGLVAGGRLFEAGASGGQRWGPRRQCGACGSGSNPGVRCSAGTAVDHG